MYIVQVDSSRLALIRITSKYTAVHMVCTLPDLVPLDNTDLLDTLYTHVGA